MAKYEDGIKAMKEEMKNKVVCFDQEQKIIYAYEYEPTPGNLANLKINVRSGVLFFNDMPEAVAHCIWTKFNKDKV